MSWLPTPLYACLSSNIGRFEFERAVIDDPFYHLLWEFLVVLFLHLVSDTASNLNTSIELEELGADFAWCKI